MRPTTRCGMLDAPMKRVVLLCHERTGSTLLVQALDQHPEVCFRGEIFVEKEEDRRTNAFGGRWYRDGEDGAAFLREVVWRDHAPVVGFKLMYHHARSSGVWEELAADPQLHVLHLTRD